MIIPLPSSQHQAHTLPDGDPPDLTSPPPVGLLGLRAPANFARSIALGVVELGTNINSANCPTSSNDASKFTSVFLGLHITGSGYFENVWVWIADPDNAFGGRGVLVESTGPVWLVGTASEHHMIYQYAFKNAQNVYAGLIQTETPYFQPNPKAPTRFFLNPMYGDVGSDQLVDVRG
ncbi:hypothetical protein B0H14DRAFT_3495100 [Mycena olivaceomarginata]|nr:hypothetical protein B0H14DRAFT_3495100 [Mycena olivaceomarginata]